MPLLPTTMTEGEESGNLFPQAVQHSHSHSRKGNGDDGKHQKEDKRAHGTEITENTEHKHL